MWQNFRPFISIWRNFMSQRALLPLQKRWQSITVKSAKTFLTVPQGPVLGEPYHTVHSINPKLIEIYTKNFQRFKENCLRCLFLFGSWSLNTSKNIQLPLLANLINEPQNSHVIMILERTQAAALYVFWNKCCRKLAARL